MVGDFYDRRILRADYTDALSFMARSRKKRPRRDTQHFRRLIEQGLFDH